MNFVEVALPIYFCIITIVQSLHQPHIILIVADDVGWNDVGFHGSNQIPTPNIDALAYNGVILNRFYTLPTCTPSRAALLTGQYPIRLGLQGIPISAGQNRYLPLDVPTLPEKLKGLGYATNLIGKWHLGSSFRNVTPTSRGFDRHFGYWNGYIGYFSHYARGINMTGLDMHNNLEPAWETQGEYATTLITRKAEEVISAHDSSRPLFLMVSHLAAHTGNNDDLQVPDVAENNKLFHYIADEERRLYAGVVSELDKSVGKVVEALSRKGILDDSIIVFISDNGAQTVGNQHNGGSNWPLRGLKFSVHDGGVRNIALMYSSLLKNRGEVNTELIHITDLMPTLYAAAGGAVDDFGKIDGVNQWPTLISNQKSGRSELLLTIDEVEKSSGFMGENGRFKLINGSTASNENNGRFFGEDGSASPLYDTTVVMQSASNSAIRGALTHDKILQLRNQSTLGNCRNNRGGYVLCTYKNICLFDLFADPCETTNVADSFPDIVTKLEGQLAEYWKQLQPQKIISPDPKANPIYYNNTWHTWLEDN